LRSLHTSLPRRKRTVKVKEEVVPEHIRLERIKEEERKEALRAYNLVLARMLWM
jgi:DNA-directed RNA polymerase subunit H (RpoH/RPB5)